MERNSRKFGMHGRGLSPPEDLDTKIWRYEKSEHLMTYFDNGSLYFANAYEVDDPNEGLPPESITKMYKAIYEAEAKGSRPIEDDMKRVKQFFEDYKHAVFLSCWHLDEGESLDRWKRYLDKGKDIAIQSTYMKLEKANWDKMRRRYSVSKVNYINHSVDDVSNYHDFTIFLQKDKQYEYESELRAICFDPTQSNQKGVRIQINLEKVLERIVISPWASETVRDKVVAALKRNSLNIAVQHSRFRLSKDYLTEQV